MHLQLLQLADFTVKLLTLLLEFLDSWSRRRPSKGLVCVLQELALSRRNLIWVQLETLGQFGQAFAFLQSLYGHLYLEFGSEFSTGHSHGFNVLKYSCSLTKPLVGFSGSITQWCIQLLEDAVSRYGRPEIVKSDECSQYTSIGWSRYVEHELGSRISMDGIGRTLDNRWIECFWNTIKYDHIYLHPADDGFELFEGVQNHIGYYNQKNHQTLKGTPDETYGKSMETLTKNQAIVV